MCCNNVEIINRCIECCNHTGQYPAIEAVVMLIRAIMVSILIIGFISIIREK